MGGNDTQVYLGTVTIFLLTGLLFLPKRKRESERERERERERAGEAAIQNCERLERLEKRNRLEGSGKATYSLAISYMHTIMHTITSLTWEV